MNKQFNKKNNKGFTLIEIMIAISVFTVVMVSGIGAVLNTNNIHKKTQTMRAVIDNLSFATEDMARNLRLGSDYVCADIGFNAGGCKELVFTDMNNTPTHYSFEPDLAGKIFLSKRKSTDPASLRMTSPEVDFQDSGSSFNIFGTNIGDGQPRVIIRLRGKVKIKEQETEFNLQTTVSQRALE